MPVHPQNWLLQAAGCAPLAQQRGEPRSGMGGAYPLARSPTSATLRFEYASLLERLREPVAAAEAYRQAIRLDPGPEPAQRPELHR